MHNILNKAAILLDRKFPLKVDSRWAWPANSNIDTIDALLGISFLREKLVTDCICKPGSYEIVTGYKIHQKYRSCLCTQTPAFIRIVKTAYDIKSHLPYLLKNTFLDGCTINIGVEEFDPIFYLNYINKFISSDLEFYKFLFLFAESYKRNSWFLEMESIWILWLCNYTNHDKSPLKKTHVFMLMCRGLKFLECEQFNRFGFLLLISIFDVKYAKTSKSIVTHIEVATRLKAKTTMSEFINGVNKTFTKEAKYDWKVGNQISLAWWRDWRPIISLKGETSVSLCVFNWHFEFEGKKTIIQKLIRNIENEIRVEKGYSVVGGMITETILYRELKNHYSDYQVISQYRANWLGRQSLDIYIEELRVGLEYQGEQHWKPVDFFGGQAALKKTKNRDRAKREKCRLNGCKLIYVRPGFSLERVLGKINEVSAC